MTAIIVSILAAPSRRKRAKSLRLPHYINAHTFGEHELEFYQPIDLFQTLHANTQIFGAHAIENRVVQFLATTAYQNLSTIRPPTLEPVGVISVEAPHYQNTNFFGSHEIEPILEEFPNWLFVDGLESYNEGTTAGNLNQRWTQSGGAVEWLSTGGRNGKGCIKRTTTSSNFWTPVFNGGEGVAAEGLFHFAFWARFPDGVPSSGARWFTYTTDGANNEALIRIGRNGRVHLTALRSASFSEPNFTVIAEEGGGAGLGYLADKAGQWVHVEGQIRLKGEEGSFQLWLDGEEILSHFGAMSEIEESPIHRMGLNSGGSPDNCEFDDFVCWQSVEDNVILDRIGITDQGYFKGHYIETFRPVANGDNVTLVPTSGANYENVNEVFQDGTSTEVVGESDGQYDLYVFPQIDEETASEDIIAVVPQGYFRHNASSMFMAFRSKVEGRLGSGPIIAAPSAYAHRAQFLRYDPTTFEDWTIEKFDEAQFGHQRVGGSGGLNRYFNTQYFVETVRGRGLTPPPEGDFYENAYITLTIKAGKVGEDLINFPTMVDLSRLPEEFLDRISETAGNLKAYDSNNIRMPIDIIRWDKDAGEGFVFCKVPTIYAAQDTTFQLRTYTGGSQPKPRAVDYGRMNVWADYECVLFFDDGDGWTDHASKTLFSAGTTAHNNDSRSYLDNNEGLFAGRALRLHNESSEATNFAVWGLLSGELEEVTFAASLMTTRQSTSANYGAGSLYNSANAAQRFSMGWRGSDSSGSDAMQAWDSTNSWLNATPRFIPDNDSERFRSHIQYSAASGGTRRHVINGPDGYVASAAFTSRPITDAVNIGRAQPNSSSEPGNFEFGFVYVRAEYLNDHWLRAEYDMLMGNLIDYDNVEEPIPGGVQHWNPDTSNPALSQTLILEDVAKLAASNWQWVSAKAYQPIEGKKYWEGHVIEGGAFAFGLGDQYATNDYLIGEQSGVVARHVTAGLRHNGRFHWGLVQTFIDTGFTFQTGDVVMLAFDADTGHLWVGKNGAWFNDVDPSTGSNPIRTMPNDATIQKFNYTPIYYPMVSVYDAAIAGRFQAAVQTYSPPSGFTAFD